MIQQCLDGSVFFWQIISRAHGVFWVAIDAADRDRLKPWSWHVRMNHDGTPYVAANIKLDGRWRSRLLHRWLLSPPPDMDVDHINGWTLDNTRKNLRVATAAENLANGFYVPRRSKSGYRGVTWMANTGKWKAVVHSGAVWTYLGLYDCPHTAAIVVSEWREKNLPGVIPWREQAERQRALAALEGK